MRRRLGRLRGRDDPVAVLIAQRQSSLTRIQGSFAGARIFAPHFHGHERARLDVRVDGDLHVNELDIPAARREDASRRWPQAGRRATRCPRRPSPA